MLRWLCSAAGRLSVIVLALLLGLLPPAYADPLPPAPVVVVDPTPPDEQPPLVIQVFLLAYRPHGPPAGGVVIGAVCTSRNAAGVFVALDDGSGPRGVVVFGSYIDETLAVARTARGKSTKWLWITNDRRYSPVAVTDAGGVVVERFEYTAYGEQTPLAGEGKAPFKINVGYTGRTVDSTGLMYFRARMYAPGLGRFANLDPAGYVDGMSLYAGYFASGGMDPSGCGEADYDAIRERRRQREERENPPVVPGRRYPGEIIMGPAQPLAYRPRDTYIPFTPGIPTGMKVYDQVNTDGFTGITMVPEYPVIRGDDALYQIMNIVSLSWGTPLTRLSLSCEEKALRLAHLTNARGYNGIMKSGMVWGDHGVYAIPFSRAMSDSSLLKSYFTGILPEYTSHVVVLPQTANDAFHTIIPLGPFSAWKATGGVRATWRPGSVDIVTGQFTPSGSILKGPLTTIYGPDIVFWGGVGAKVAIEQAYGE